MEVFVITVTNPKISSSTGSSSWLDSSRAFVKLIEKSEQHVFATEKSAIRFILEKFQALEYSKYEGDVAVMNAIIFALENDKLDIALPLINSVFSLPVSVKKLTLEGHVLS